MHKHITLFDSSKSKENINLNKTWARGEVIFKDIDTGKVLWTLHNKVLIAGSQFVAQKVFNLPEPPAETQGQKNGKAIKTVLGIIEKGVGNQMNENLKKMLETFGIKIEEGKTVEELCNQLADNYAAIPEVEQIGRASCRERV